MQFSKILKESKFQGWNEFEEKLKEIDSTNKKGDIFEEFIYCYLNLKKEEFQIKEVYMLKEAPEELLDELKIEREDYGVDGVFIAKDDSKGAYQVKFKGNRGKLTHRELSTFWAQSEYADMRYVFSNSYELPDTAHKKHNQYSVLIDKLDELGEDFFDNLYRFVNDEDLIKKRYTPFPHQENMIEDVLGGFKKYDRGKLIAACGTGKTMAALWILERLQSDLSLYVAPSLALIKQTIEEWTEQSEKSFKYLAVCSDKTVAQDAEYDDFDLDIAELNFPVTTDHDKIRAFLENNTGQDKQVVFCTYHSLEAIVLAIENIKEKFDFAVFDEAHKTAGKKDSEMFTYGLYDEYIPIEKRLFMTATEKLVTPRVESLVEKYGGEIFSMDDEGDYGPVFYDLTFGEAIKKEIISDYKVIICSIEEEELYEIINENYILNINIDEKELDEISARNILKQILLGKAINEFGISKIISFHSRIRNAQDFLSGGNYNADLRIVLKAILEQIVEDKYIALKHINGSMSAGSRKRKMDAFEKSDLGILTNARCLVEGVDMPNIDCVLFADKKTSHIDIVQAVGRALRKNNNDKTKDTSYIILPVIVPEEVTSFEGIEAEKFETLHSVLQALRSQDERMAEIIDRINLRAGTKKKGSRQEDDDLLPGNRIVHLPYTEISIENFSENLSFRIADVNSEPEKIYDKEKIDKKSDRKSDFNRTFSVLGDYNWTTIRDNLVFPTIDLFDNKNQVKTYQELEINNNNRSHSRRVGAIKKINSSKTVLTPIGRMLYDSHDLFESIYKEQILKHVEESDKKDVKLFFPYRAIFKLFKKLDLSKVKSINKTEFIYSVLTLQDSKDDDIERAVNRLEYLRESIPNMEILNERNKRKIHGIIDKKFDLNWDYREAWSSSKTTSNLYGYFKNHISTYDDIFKENEFGVRRDKGIKELNKLLDKYLDATKEAENIAQEYSKRKEYIKTNYFISKTTEIV